MNYTEYIVDKEERLARQEELYQIQQREISRLEMALKRYKQWVLINDKFASRMHAMEARIERIEKVDRPVLEHRKMGLELNGWRGSNQLRRNRYPGWADASTAAYDHELK